MTPEAMLRKLITDHFYLDGYGRRTWPYIEGTAISDMDPELGAAIEAFMKQEAASGN